MYDDYDKDVLRYFENAYNFICSLYEMLNLDLVDGKEEKELISQITKNFDFNCSIGKIYSIDELM